MCHGANGDDDEYFWKIFTCKQTAYCAYAVQLVGLTWMHFDHYK